MKKRDLKKLALLGLTGGMLLANQSQLHAQSSEQGSIQVELTEAELLAELSPEAQLLYMGLDAQGQTLARLITSDRCSCTGEGGGGELLARGGPHNCGAHSCNQTGNNPGYPSNSPGYPSNSTGYYDTTGHYYGGNETAGCGNVTNMPQRRYNPGMNQYQDQPQYQQGQPAQYPNQPYQQGQYQNQTYQQEQHTHYQGQPSGQPPAYQDQSNMQGNTNRSMPRFEDQPRYQQNQSGYQQSPTPATQQQPNKPMAARDTNYRSNPARYLAQEETNSAVMSDSEFRAKLSDSDNKKLFDSWVSSDREKADNAKASASCTGKNKCAGLNGCQDAADHKCRGLGNCQGTQQKPMSADEAVKQVEKMSKKRTALRGR